MTGPWHRRRASRCPAPPTRRRDPRAHRLGAAPHRADRRRAAARSRRGRSLALTCALFAVGVAALAADHIDRWTDARPQRREHGRLSRRGRRRGARAGARRELAKLPGVEHAELVAGAESAAASSSALGADSALLEGVDSRACPRRSRSRSRPACATWSRSARPCARCAARRASTTSCRGRRREKRRVRRCRASGSSHGPAPRCSSALALVIVLAMTRVRLGARSRASTRSLHLLGAQPAVHGRADRARRRAAGRARRGARRASRCASVCRSAATASRRRSRRARHRRALVAGRAQIAAVHRARRGARRSSAAVSPEPAVRALACSLIAARRDRARGRRCRAGRAVDGVAAANSDARTALADAARRRGRDARQTTIATVDDKLAARRRSAPASPARRDAHPPRAARRRMRAPTSGSPPRAAAPPPACCSSAIANERDAARRRGAAPARPRRPRTRRGRRRSCRAIVAAGAARAAGQRHDRAPLRHLPARSRRKPRCRAAASTSRSKTTRAAIAPADGVVRYAGPIRGLDHGVILDHGDYFDRHREARRCSRSPVGARSHQGDRLGLRARHRVYLEVRVKLGPGGLPIDPEPLLEPVDRGRPRR